MPKIVMVNTVSRGSHGRLMADLCREATRAGFSVTQAFGRGGPPEGDYLRIGARRDVLYHVALTRLFDRHARGSRHATEAFVRKLQADPPDLLHLHNVHGYYLHLETLFAYIRSAGIKTLWTLHDCWALTGHCSHFTRVSCSRYRDGCHDCPQKREYPASRWMDASRKNYALKQKALTGLPNLTIAVPSAWLSQMVAGSYLAEARRIVIPNGVDLSLFQPSRDESVRAACGVSEGEAMLLSVASPFDERKGFSDALSVAERLRGRARVVLVGVSKRQQRALPPYVTGILRTKGPEEIVSLYGAADCLLNPTREDTYPTVNMEAIACGTPVAAYAVGGCVDQLAEPVGALIAPGDDRALAEAALLLAGQKDKLSGECRAYAEKKFNRADALSAYLAYYLEWIGA